MLKTVFSLAVPALLTIPLSSAVAQSSEEELTIFVTNFYDRDGLELPVRDIVVYWLGEIFSDREYINIVPLRQDFDISDEKLMEAAETAGELGGDIVVAGAFIENDNEVALLLVSVVCSDCPLQYNMLEGIFENEYNFDPSTLTGDSSPPDKFTLFARLFTAHWFWGMNRLEESAEILDAALQNTENAIPSHVFLASYLAGIEYTDLERPADAVEAFTRALALRPADLETLSLRASAFDALHMYDQAIRDLKTALEIDPDNPRYRAQLGAQLKQAGRYEEALEYLNPAIESEPSNAMSWRDRSRTFYELGDLESALSDINRAMELDPTSTQGVAMRGIILWEMGNAEEALADFNMAIRLEQDPLVRVWSVMGRANCLIEQGDYSEAITDLESVLAFDSTFYSAHFLLGKCKLELGDTAAARISLEKYLECPVGFCSLDPWTKEEMTTEAESMLESMD